MYDEYPDQLQLRLMCRRVYDRMMREEKEELEMADEEDVEQQYLQMGRQQNGRNRKDRDQHLREIIEILLFHNCLRGEVITEKEGEDTIKVQMKIVC